MTFYLLRRFVSFMSTIDSTNKTHTRQTCNNKTTKTDRFDSTHLERKIVVERVHFFI